MSIEKATADTERATVAIGNYRTHLDETKRGLAKLLARENISVRHEAVSTAMFDIVNRVLVLPKFDSVSVDQYDLLIGHEVGHAKYSSGPTSVAILEKCRDFDGLHTYVNVLEDTRIERLMKDEYPGLRASFRRGYADFATHGPLFQEVVGEDIASYSFIDRINIQYKVGAHRDVPFTDAERDYFPRIDTLDSMTAVYALAKELYDADVDKQKSESKQQDDGQDPGEEDSQQGQGNQDNQDTEDSENQNGDAQSGDDSGEDSEQDGEGQKDAQKGDAQDGASEDSDTEDGDAEDGDADGPSGGTDTRPSRGPHAETDVANSKALEGIASTDEDHFSAPISVDLRPLTATQVEEFEVPFFADAEEFFGVYPEAKLAAQNYLDKFTEKHGATVKFMAREFELKKAAKLAERAKTSRTGRLDVSKLYAYKFREDLFKSVTILPTGKSHGVVVVIDGSGSMNDVMSDTLDQALLFGTFAKAVGIPFKAVVFSTDRYGNYQHTAPKSTDAGSKTLVPVTGDLRLSTVLDTTAPKWKEQLTATAAFALKYDSTYYGTGSYELKSLPHSDLGATPLYSTLLVAENFVATMKTAHRLDKTTLLIVTDGDDSAGLDIEYGDGTESKNVRRGQALVIRDTVTRKVYENYVGPDGTGYYRPMVNAIPSALIGSIQARHNTRVVTIKVLSKNASRSYRRRSIMGDLLQRASQFARCYTEERYANRWSITEDDAKKSLKETGQIVFKSTDIIGDAAILVSATRLKLDTDEDSLRGGTVGNPKAQTPAQIKRAFVKRSVGSSKNRVFVQTVIPFLA